EDFAYMSRLKIERVKGPLRRAYLPQKDEPVLFVVHSERQNDNISVVSCSWSVESSEFGQYIFISS
ncbi:MAG: hypothetical protein PVF60_07425, partial [Desulfobacterales bacterium]